MTHPMGMLFLPLFLSLAALGGSDGASADATSDAKAKVNQAYRDYYEKLSNREGTPAELKAKTLEPARNEYRKAHAEETREALKSLSKGAPEPASREKGGMSVESVSPGDTAASPGSGSYGSSGPVLDGSNVPRELEFPGKPKPSARPGAK